MTAKDYEKESEEKENELNNLKRLILQMKERFISFILIKI